MSLCFVEENYEKLASVSNLVFNVGEIASFRLHRLRENDEGDMVVTRMCWDIHKEIFANNHLSEGEKTNRINDPFAIAHSFKKGVVNYFTLPVMRDPNSPIHKLFMANKTRFNENTWAYLTDPNYQQRYNIPGVRSTISRKQIGNPHYEAIRADAIHTVRTVRTALIP